MLLAIFGNLVRLPMEVWAEVEFCGVLGKKSIFVLKIEQTHRYRAMWYLNKMILNSHCQLNSFLRITTNHSRFCNPKRQKSNELVKCLSKTKLIV